MFAFLLESLMLAYVPEMLVAAWLGSVNDWALPLAVAIGVPAYLNGYAAIPLVAGHRHGVHAGRKRDLDPGRHRHLVAGEDAAVRAVCCGWRH